MHATKGTKSVGDFASVEGTETGLISEITTFGVCI